MNSTRLCDRRLCATPCAAHSRAGAHGGLAVTAGRGEVAAVPSERLKVISVLQAPERSHLMGHSLLRNQYRGLHFFCNQLRCFSVSNDGCAGAQEVAALDQSLCCKAGQGQGSRVNCFQGAVHCCSTHQATAAYLLLLCDSGRAMREIVPSDFDLIVVGTGLQEALLAA